MSVGKLVVARTGVADRDAVRGAILTVAAQKGGVGKTTLAYELAAVLDGVLIDLDFHGGGATNLWGFDPLAVTRAPLLEALEQGPNARPPRPKRGPSRPDLVPSHPDLSAARLDADAVAEALEAWAIAWGGRTLIVDTHPGAHWTTDGAVQVADLVVSPIPPGRREVAATEAMLREHEDYPFLLVPSMVPPSPPAHGSTRCTPSRSANMCIFHRPSRSTVGYAAGCSRAPSHANRALALGRSAPPQSSKPSRAAPPSYV
jgi:chromosome partitioning protein